MATVEGTDARQPGGGEVGHGALVQERSARRAAEQAAAEATRRLSEALGATHRTRSILDASADIVVVFDLDGVVVDLNAAGRHLAGLGPNADLARMELDALVSDESRAVLERAVLPALTDGREWTGELVMARFDGSALPARVVAQSHIHGGTVTGSLLARDISDHKVYEAELHYRAYYDELTGLPTQTLFLDEVRRNLAAGVSVAVGVLSLVDYRMVNETLGRDAGDRLLVAVADRLHGLVGAGVALSRLGGSDFALAAEGLSGAEMDALGRRLVEGLRKPFVVEGRQLVVRAVVGTALSAGERDHAETLLRDAEVALAHATDSGTPTCRFDEPMRMRAVERLETEHDLRRGLHRNEVVLHYQPEVRLDGTGLIEGFEGLARWRHPVREMVPPGAFIPVAEATGLIVPLGQRVLDLAVAQIAMWAETSDDVEPPFISANVSPRQLVQDDFVASVADVVERHGIEPALLALELTESVFTSVDESTLSRLDDLRSLGVRLVVDDFGAGYSSLRYVKHFPIDILKIDRTFVMNIGHDAEDRAIVRAVIDMSHALGVRVVAEGVETAEQAAILADMECDLAQGWYFGRPEPAQVHVAAMARR